MSLMGFNGGFHVYPDSIPRCSWVLKKGDVESDPGCCSDNGWLEGYVHIMDGVCSTSCPHGVVQAVSCLLDNTKVLEFPTTFRGFVYP
jgi:hypothetical protein